MRRSLTVLTTAATVGATLAMVGCSGNGESITATDAAVGANPGDAAALYVELTNDGEDDQLVSARCDCAGKASLHLTEDRDGVLLMVESETIELPSGERETLRPGGPHVMLEDLDAPLTAGSTVEVTLGFENAEDIVIDVPVVALEDLAERVENADAAPTAGSGSEAASAGGR
ncbi:MAG: copper chaperone PCu(A)C [Microthrixaceae bacterium]